MDLGGGGGRPYIYIYIYIYACIYTYIDHAAKPVSPDYLCSEVQKLAYAVRAGGCGVFSSKRHAAGRKPHDLSALSADAPAHHA